MTFVAAHPLVVALNLLASAIWVGGLVAIAVVAQVARRTLDPSTRVAFFRRLGRAYGLVGGASLAVALGTGAALLPRPLGSGRNEAAIALAAALVVATIAGVRQARSITRLRVDALSRLRTPEMNERVRRATLRATVLRASIGSLTLALLALAAVIAT